MKVEVTKTQIKAMICARDTFEAMIGVASDDSEFKWMVKNINRFLKKNKLQEEAKP